MSKSDAQKAAGASAISKPAVIAGVCAAAVIVGGGILYATGVIGGPKGEEAPGVKYASEGVVLLEEGGVYDEIDANSIALEFKNDAYSSDGKTFSCYLGNSALNSYDMFIAIYEDTSLTDEAMLYLSDLVRPGNGFGEITLDRTLEVGDHQVVVAFTQMEDPNTIHAQTLYTMDFHVLPSE